LEWHEIVGAALLLPCHKLPNFVSDFAGVFEWLDVEEQP
jgi:hypothetical protein